MMQPVQHTQLVNFSAGLDASRFRRIHVNPRMRPLSVVVVDVPLQYRPQMTLIQDDRMVQAFPPDASDKSFAISILPRRSVRGQDGTNAKSLHRVRE